MTTLMKRKTSNGNLPETSLSGFVNRLFPESFDQLFDDNFWGFNGLQRKMSVPVNVKETDKSYEIELVAPGLNKKDFNVSLSGDTLTVSFEHNSSNQKEDTNEGWLRQEYSMQSFSRSFSLDDTVDAGKVTAKYNDGILYLTLPKKEGAQKVSRTVEIK